MEKRHFITIADPTKDGLVYLLAMAEQFEAHSNHELLKGKAVATSFYESSTRICLSFETIVSRLGTCVIGFSDAKASNASKGETPEDVILMVSNYADLTVVHHYIEGAAQYTDEVTPAPIINASDDAYMHPSRCSLDLYSIYRTQGTLKNLNIYLVDDLKYGRTIHLLIVAMQHFNLTFRFTAPNGLSMPMGHELYCQEDGIKYQEYTAFNSRMLVDTDILYMARVQKECFSDLMEYEHVKSVYILCNDMLKNVKDDLKILHPLPRVDKIAYDVDNNPYVYYIRQAQDGLYARQAVFSRCLDITLEDIKQDRTIIK